MYRAAVLRKFLTWFSLAGLTITGALWLGSYWTIFVRCSRPTWGYDLIIADGCLHFEYMVYSLGGPRGSTFLAFFAGFDGLATVWMPPIAFNAGRPGFPDVTVLFPINLLALLFMISSVYLLLPRHRYRRRVAQGLCGKCGYDLTGNTSGTCPECGEAVAPARVACSRPNEIAPASIPEPQTQSSRGLKSK